MPPRKRSSTATDGNGPSKRARSGSPEEGSDGNSASPPPPPRPTRFSEVSATANTWKIWRQYIAKDPGYAHGYMCLCKLPHDDEDDEEDEGDDEGPEESEGEARPGEGKRPRCERGRACVCFKPLAGRPDHKKSVSRAGYKLLGYQVTLASLRNPDSFGMYTFNDQAAFGILEVVESALVDFNDLGADWRDRWALCEAVVMFLLSDMSAEMFMCVAEMSLFSLSPPPPTPGSDSSVALLTVVPQAPRPRKAR